VAEANVTLADWRDLSIILLVFEAFIIGLIPLVIFLALNKGVFELNRRIGIAGLIVRSYFRKAEEITKIASGRIAAPFIAANATAAQVKRIPQALMSSSKEKHEV
jgi:hypothetical protein